MQEEIKLFKQYKSSSNSQLLLQYRQSDRVVSNICELHFLVRRPDDLQPLRWFGRKYRAQSDAVPPNVALKDTVGFMRVFWTNRDRRIGENDGFVEWFHPYLVWAEVYHLVLPKLLL